LRLVLAGSVGVRIVGTNLNDRYSSKGETSGCECEDKGKDEGNQCKQYTGAYSPAIVRDK
jgi:hypothetical protein